MVVKQSRITESRLSNSPLRRVNLPPSLHTLQAEAGGDIAVAYSLDNPMGLVLNSGDKLIS